MPELPEVETVRRSIQQSLVGRTVIGVQIQSFPGVLGDDPDRAIAGLLDETILDVRRRGKYLILPLEDGNSIVIHLRMTGQLQLANRSDPPLRFEHIALQLEDSVDLRFADQRKFGRVLVVGQPAIDALDRRLGPEPLSSAFTTRYLSSVMQNRTAKIKSLILGQEVIAGLGNIYADEALFRAKVHPERPAMELTFHETAALHRAIRSVLRESIERKGTTFSSFIDGYGLAGTNGPNLRVYGRGRRGDPCPRCHSALSLLIVGGRSSHYCPVCQQRQPARDVESE